MNQNLLRQSLSRLSLGLGAVGLIALTPPILADDKNPGATTGGATPGGTAPSANSAAPKAGPSGTTKPTGGAGGTPNSARPTNSDGTPADADNVATGYLDRPGMIDQSNRQKLDPSITSTWVKGAAIPKDLIPVLVELPPVEKPNVAIRYREGRIYYIQQNDWKIVRVAELDPGTGVTPLDSVLGEGDVVPDQLRAALIEVPTPEPGTTVRVYHRTAYYLDTQNRILRTVSLELP